MERERLQSMSLDELWQLHMMVNGILAARLVAKKEELERRLGLLNREDTTYRAGFGPEE
jgi:DNA-binding protein H-NS